MHASSAPYGGFLRTYLAPQRARMAALAALILADLALQKATLAEAEATLTRLA